MQTSNNSIANTMELLQSCTNPWKCYKIMSSMKMTCWLQLITSITFLVCMCVNLFVSVYELTGDPPHNRAELHTTEHCAAHNRASCRQNGGTWTRRFGTKTSGVRVFKCVTGTIVVKALFSVMVRHTLGKTNNCSEYSKVKNAICKHARLSKHICQLYSIYTYA